MNATRLAIVAIIGSALIGGVLMYYQLVYAGFAELEPDQIEDVQLVSVVTAEPEPILFENVKAMDTVKDGVRLSEGVSFRACFDGASSLAMLTETYVIMDNAEPLNAPSWFDCFDAQAIGAALETGEAVGFLGTQNITFGVDRAVAIYPDGRGYVWHQLNACGEALFAGDTPPDDCPPVPEDF